MATIINTPPNVTTDSGDSGAGWAVAVIILIAVVGVGVYFWYYRGAPAAGPTTNTYNVTVPDIVTPTTP